MNKPVATTILSLLLASYCLAEAPAATSVQTLVFFRHGERPYGGMGQITPQGLIRALALPDVLFAKFGKPDFLFAPSPLEKVKELDTGKSYYYIRPLATLEPTAIRCGLPINLGIGYTKIGALQKELARPKYWNATVFIAWEHLEICDLARQLMKRYGANPDQVPRWHEHDFDSIYVFTITRKNGKVVSIRFARTHEGLNNASPSRIRFKLSPANFTR